MIEATTEEGPAVGLLARGRQRALRLLAADEVVVASLQGIEAEGRRRRFVLVTDRRLLVGSARGEEPTDLALIGTTARFETARSRLIIDSDGAEIALRDVDPGPARALVAVLDQHRGPSDVGGPARPGVRVLDGVAHDTA